MKILQYLLGILAVGLSLSWAMEINDYFFKSNFLDDLALIITVVLSTIACRFVRLKPPPIPVVLGTLLPWSLFLMISSLIENTNWGFLALHTFLILMILFIISNIKSNWSLMIVGSLAAIHLVATPTLPDQKYYYDRVVSTLQTRHGLSQIVQWKNDKWHYYNSQLLFSTVDNHIWREAYIQPVMQLVPDNANVLLIGGESGELKYELKKFDIHPTILPYDVEFQQLTQDRELIRDKILTGGIYKNLESLDSTFDLVLIDLLDPTNVEYGQFYTTDFYRLCSRVMTKSGFLVTHSGEILAKNIKPKSIWENAEKAGFDITPYHAQIPTIGHWTWFIGAKDLTDIKGKFQNIDPKHETKWWSQEAMDMMLSFGRYELLEGR